MDTVIELPIFSFLHGKIFDDNGFDQTDLVLSLKRKNKEAKSREMMPYINKYWIVPAKVRVKDKEIINDDEEFLEGVEYNLTYAQRLFLTFENATWSVSGKFLNIIFLLAAILCTLFFIVATVPEIAERPSTCEMPVCFNTTLCPNDIVCEPQSPQSFEDIQVVCTIIFTVDYVVRILTVTSVPPPLLDCMSHLFVQPKLSEGPDDDADDDEVLFNSEEDVDHDALLGVDPNWIYVDSAGRPNQISRLYVFCSYSFTAMNIIDLLAIVPFYIMLLGFNSFSVAIVRILRLARVFRYEVPISPYHSYLSNSRTNSPPNMLHLMTYVPL